MLLDLTSVIKTEHQILEADENCSISININVTRYLSENNVSKLNTISNKFYSAITSLRLQTNYIDFVLNKTCFFPVI